MSDLTDKELESMARMGERADLMSRAAIELQRHRTAVRADAERVRQVVREAYQAEMVVRGGGAVGPQARQIGDFVDAMSIRVAEQLASAVPSSDLATALCHLYDTSERAPDVRYVPMRLVRQDAFDAVMEATKVSVAPAPAPAPAPELESMSECDELLSCRAFAALKGLSNAVAVLDRLLGASR